MRRLITGMRLKNKLALLGIDSFKVDQGIGAYGPHVTTTAVHVQQPTPVIGTRLGFPL